MIPFIVLPIVGVCLALTGYLALDI